MPLFVCDECHAIDNTACGGTYWTKDLSDKLWPDDAQGRALCCECTPDHYRNGESNPEGGKWHGHFKKEIATPEVIERIGREHFVYLGPFEAEPSDD